MSQPASLPAPLATGAGDQRPGGAADRPAGPVLVGSAGIFLLGAGLLLVGLPLVLLLIGLWPSSSGPARPAPRMRRWRYSAGR